MATYEELLKARQVELAASRKYLKDRRESLGWIGADIKTLHKVLDRSRRANDPKRNREEEVHGMLILLSRSVLRQEADANLERLDRKLEDIQQQLLPHRRG